MTIMDLFAFFCTIARYAHCTVYRCLCAHFLATYHIAFTNLRRKRLNRLVVNSNLDNPHCEFPCNNIPPVQLMETLDQKFSSWSGLTGQESNIFEICRGWMWFV